MNLNFTEKLTKAVICAVFLFIGFSSVTAASKKSGTVYLKDGSKYENVIFSADKYYKIITLELENKELKVSFSDIDRIYNDKDEDITEEIIGKTSSSQIDRNQEKASQNDRLTQREQKQAKIWNSERSEAYQEARKKLWNTAFLFSPTYTAPSGYYYTGTEGGIGFAGNVMFAMTRKIALRFHYSQPKINLKAPFDYISTSTNRFIVSLQYNSYTTRDMSDKSMIYFFSGLGVIEDELESHFTMSIGGGVIEMVSESVGINFELGLDMPGIYDEEVEAMLFDLRIGFAFVI